MNSATLFHFWQMMAWEALYAGLVFAMVAGLTRLLPGASPRWRFGLWSLVFVRLILPPKLTFGFSLPSLLRRALSDDVSQVLPIGAMAEVPLTSLPGSLVQATVVNSSGWPWLVLTLLWIGGVTYFLLAYARTRARFRRLAATADEVTEPAALALLAKWKQELGIRASVRLVSGNPSISPFTIGWLRPIIFLPRALRPSTLEAVIAHEAAHIKRRDDLWIRLQSLVGAFYFFHPAVWLAARELDHERERNCDRMVVSRGKINANTYGRCILEVLRLQLEWTPATAALGSRGRKMEKRIRSLAGYQDSARRFGFFGWLGMALLGLFLLPMAGAASEMTPAQQPDDPEVSLSDPLPGARVSSAFGQRRNPFTGKIAHHRGADLVAPAGALILAPADGTVVLATRDYEKGLHFGTVVLIDHSNGIRTFYAHLDKLLVEAGAPIVKGEALGTPGNTGQTTARHLHFEVWRDGQPIDPAELVPGLSER